MNKNNSFVNNVQKSEDEVEKSFNENIVNDERYQSFRC